MIMLDGFGVPPEGWDGSVYAELCSTRFISLFRDYSIPIDAILGVPGIPQSATGQTALFCGINAPAAMGRHVHAFPGERLSEIIREKNIFKAVMERGKRPVFANAYVRHNLHELAASRFRSVTTVMTAATLGKAFTADDLRRGEAVFHDITNRTLPPEADIPIIQPETAAANLLRLAAAHDLTLFEYFLSDRVGHKCDQAMLQEVLSELDRFLCALTDNIETDTILVLSADHGNCEAPDSPLHSQNPVPLLIYPYSGKPAVNSIDQVYDFILSLLCGNFCPARECHE